MNTYARRTARVLLLDAAGRVLLIRWARAHDQPERGYVWITPGGGVEPGEELAAAAARELHEETGLAAAPASLQPVAYASGTSYTGWVQGLLRDDFFLHRVTSHQVDNTRLTEFERRHYLGHRWWTQPELAATADTVHPAGLAALLADVLDGQPHPDPVRLPWPHD